MDETDIQKKDVPRQRTSSSVTEITEEQLQATVLRILYCTFDNASGSRIYLPHTADDLKTNTSLSIRDIISNALMEVVVQISKGNNPFKDLMQSNDAADTSSINSLSPSPSPSHSCPIPTLPTKRVEVSDSPLNHALNYLMECYNRVSVEERNHPKRSSIPPLSDVLTEIRAQIIQYTTLLLKGYIIPNDELYKFGRSPLLSPILEQTLPRGFLTEIVTRTHTNAQLFSSVFSPLLQGLYRMMQNASIVGEEHRMPIQTLFELADIRCGSRPICTLITKQVQFMLEPCTPAQGREIVRTSFLGPFLSVSVFAEDEPKVAEKFFSGNSSSDKSLNHTLQLELENTRNLQHRIFHYILANPESRDACLNYLAKVLKYNEKRSQLQMEERSLAGDGFMLNLLSVLQMLSLKIKLDKMDFLYPFHPESLICIKNETRLKYTSQDVATWLESLGKLE